MTQVTLIKYDAARSALAEASRVDEVKSIRDKAIALGCYARQAKDTTMAKWVAEIKARAERRAGELLQAAERNHERKPRGQPREMSNRADITPSLSDLGISRDQSSQWQRVAKIPEKTFEHVLATATKPVTTRAVLADGTCSPVKAKDRAFHVGAFIGAIRRAIALYLAVKDYDTDELIENMSKESLTQLNKDLGAVTSWLSEFHEQIGEAL